MKTKYLITFCLALALGTVAVSGDKHPAPSPEASETKFDKEFEGVSKDLNEAENKVRSKVKEIFKSEEKKPESKKKK